MVNIEANKKGYKTKASLSSLFMLMLSLLWFYINKVEWSFVEKLRNLSWNGGNPQNGM